MAEQTGQSAYGENGGGGGRPVGLLGLIAILVLVIVILLVALLQSCSGDGGGSGEVEVTREVTRVVTQEVVVPGGEVTRVVTREVPGPTMEVTRLVTETVPGPTVEIEVTRVVVEEVVVTTVVTNTDLVEVTRIVVIPPPPPQSAGDGCARINLESGRDGQRGTPGAGTYVMIQAPFDRDDNVLAVWEAERGWRDSGWLQDLPLATDVVYVQVYFYPKPFGAPILLEVVNPAPATQYGWVARGMCHAVEVQFPEGSG